MPIADGVAGLAQPPRHEAVEGREQGGAHHRDPALLGAARGDVDAARRLRALGEDAIEIGARDAQAGPARRRAPGRRCAPVSNSACVRAASRSAVDEQRAGALLLGGEPLQRRARGRDARLRRAQIGLGLVGLEPRELLPERDARSLVDEHLAQPAHEIEADRGLALALDGAAAEGLLHDGPSLHPGHARAHRAEEAEPNDEDEPGQDDHGPEDATRDMESRAEPCELGAPAWRGRFG